MDEITFKVEDLTSKDPTPLKGEFKCGTLTLKLISKKLCAHCKYERNTESRSCYDCGSNSSSIHNLEVKASLEQNCDLVSDMKKALFNENLSDFTFIVENEKIPVSKIILAARSPVFEKMFFSDFKEKNQSQQEVESPALKATFKEMIRYIYTGEVCNLNDHVYNLTHAADYYQINDLKCICEKELHKILCENNANKIFQTAHLYQCSRNLINEAFRKIKCLFQKLNLTVPEECVNNPSKVAKLFEMKEALEKELQPDDDEICIVFSNEKALNEPITSDSGSD